MTFNFRRNWILALAICLVTLHSFAAAPKKQFYQIKLYHLTSKDQETRVDNYLKDAYIPAMHRAGIKDIGVFKPVASDTAAGKLVYVLIPLKSLDQLLSIPKSLEKDAAYQSAGKDYIDAEYKNPPYARIQSTVLRAFENAPVMKKPTYSTPKSERIYELRSYEGHTEKIHVNKVKQFNAGNEIGIFDRLGFNAVFYGEVISGATMPNLMYMTTFSDKASRDAHWKSFTDDAEWGKVKTMPEYQNNVSKNVTLFLYPAEYSDY
ncbi:NIPSNAP family protein [Dyadobacter luticola]|uniref:NIPSNAP family containing protein n=1 Tax=Dyadobacter luticola TaxID=1979387 RepID=A0A5R9KNX8_9BACT|nr:NIPSNAP family protein [Dyadobacter luticola]TLU97903.1 NIPSNAP family containing protein [Dyadobacter luticola]